MSGSDGQIAFRHSDPRGILPLDTFRLPDRLARRLRRSPFQIRVDTAFREVVTGCAERSDSWISPGLRLVYEELHRRGYAHCVEAWQDGLLGGGLYGVAIGGAFFGESMFARLPDASKACLVFLVGHLKARGYRLLDCQMVTPHTRRFGAVWIPEVDYLDRLAVALQPDCRFWP